MSVQNVILRRAELYSVIREFFSERKVLEVETPVFSKSGNTDPFIQSLTANFSISADINEIHYAQTSPEFAMKRLLANGSGSIYQICKVFRIGEIGRLHNPEFSMLEWYRVGLSYHELMDEIAALLKVLEVSEKSQRISYKDLFYQYLEINVCNASIDQLKNCAAKFKIDAIGLGDNHDEWLNLLLSHLIEPKLGVDYPLFIYDYPASQAALANVRQESYPIAERFELYLNGIEIANGYQELMEGEGYRERFCLENEKRLSQNMDEIPIQNNLLEDLQKGLPYCSGVALGLDRLLMYLCDVHEIKNILTFDFSNS